MRLKTVVAEESAPRYAVAAPTKVSPSQARPRMEHTEDYEASVTPTSLTKVKKPLAHPKRVALISGAFLLFLGSLHYLSLNEAPTLPTAHAKHVVRLPRREVGGEAYLRAASDLSTPSLFYLDKQTLTDKRNVLAVNATALSLLHQALGKDIGLIDNERVYTSTLNRLLEAEYTVALADGKRAQAVEALVGMIKLDATSVRSVSDSEFLNVAYTEWRPILEKDRFTAAETVKIRAALEDLRQAEPDWETLANERERQTIEVLQSLLTGTVSRFSYGDVTVAKPLNWYNIADGSLLEQTRASMARQGAILRYGTQGVVDAYTPYITALRARALAPTAEAAAKITLPPVPKLPHSEDLGTGLERLAKAHQDWEAQREALKALKIQQTGE
ncbi:hypothetical protein [Armatimonas rosea]|uniref:Uncharacterized protein n=1 Tax=Armatimonas rosea TaxID=685828 RepID=A0A7W9STR3_ARMRO|nr:hypothetical protein [Armatimonas rosea]MBB6052506.1 hypothetical protein [Armatimonas rosea]